MKRAAIAAALLATHLPPYAAVSITDALQATDPTMSGRLFRDGEASACGPPKTFPGDFGTDAIQYRSYALYNNGPARCVMLTVTTSEECSTEFFAAAYKGVFDPTNRALNYAGDAGISVDSVSFSLDMAANSSLSMVLMSLSPDSGEGCGYTIASPELSATAEAATPADIPALSRWGLALVALALSILGLARLRR